VGFLMHLTGMLNNVMKSISGKEVIITKSPYLHKWGKNFKNIQDRFYPPNTLIRRQKQIEDFMYLNGFTHIFHAEEVRIGFEIKNNNWANSEHDADIILKTDQRLDRATCNDIIAQLDRWLDICPSLYVCLNRHYMNINNAPINLELSDDYQLAIAEWVKQSLPTDFVVDLSWDYIDTGDQFTWSIPDRHFYIKRQ